MPARIPPRLVLAELLMSAATELAVPAADETLVPYGVPVRRGRLNLGRAAALITGSGRLVQVVTGFRSVCWIGPPGATAPDLGRLTNRAQALVDDRNRLVLDRRSRAWLAIADPAGFDVVLVPAPDGGLLIVPVEDFATRWEGVSGDERRAG